MVLQRIRVKGSDGKDINKDKDLGKGGNPNRSVNLRGSVGWPITEASSSGSTYSKKGLARR
jgi:hypothetical protein